MTSESLIEEIQNLSTNEISLKNEVEQHKKISESQCDQIYKLKAKKEKLKNLEQGIEEI